VKKRVKFIPVSSITGEKKEKEVKLKDEKKMKLISSQRSHTYVGDNLINPVSNEKCDWWQGYVEVF